ncbi:hypothetical protein ACFL6I_21235 [candidate division KSB1 bacterium]
MSLFQEILNENVQTDGVETKGDEPERIILEKALSQKEIWSPERSGYDRWEGHFNHKWKLLTKYRLTNADIVKTKYTVAKRLGFVNEKNHGENYNKNFVTFFLPQIKRYVSDQMFDDTVKLFLVNFCRNSVIDAIKGEKNTYGNPLYGGANVFHDVIEDNLFIDCEPNGVKGKYSHPSLFKPGVVKSDFLMQGVMDKYLDVCRNKKGKQPDLMLPVLNEAYNGLCDRIGFDQMKVELHSMQYTTG